MKKCYLFVSILFLPVITSFSQSSPDVIKMNAVTDFSFALRNGTASNRLPFNAYHVEREWNALAGDDLNHAFHMASAEGKFSGKPGFYTVTLNTLTERDGECAYNVYVNDKSVGPCQKNPPTSEFCVPSMLCWTGVEIPADAIIRVESNSYSNLRRPEGAFFEFARGRWTGIIFKEEKDKCSSSPGILEPGSFSDCMNIGMAGAKPVLRYSEPSRVYSLIGSGNGFRKKQDKLSLLYKPSEGDFVIEAAVILLGCSGNENAGAGIMVRQSSSPGSAFVACNIQPDGLARLLYRHEENADIKEVAFNTIAADMLEIEKKGSSFIVSVARFGSTYEKNSVEIKGINGVSMTGFYVSSGSEKGKEAASFSNIRFFEY